MTYAYSDALFSNPSNVRWARSFTVYNEADEYIVGSVSGFNLKLSPTTVSAQKLQFLQTSTPENLYLRTPENCTPHFEPDTPHKIQMLNTLLQSVTDFLKVPFPGKKRYPTSLKIVVSNFNVDYPSSYVLIPATQEVLIVSFFVNSLSPFAQPPGDYVVNNIFPASLPNFVETYDEVYRDHFPKVEKYGIVREISLQSK